MPAVRVERIPVETLGLGRFGFDHLQLVFRSDFGSQGARQDDWFVIEGVREAGGADVRLAVEGWHGGTTLSEANGWLRGEALAARIGTPESRSPREIAEGGGAVELWATLAAYAADIEAQKFPYIALALPASPLPTVNSSSLVASLLHHAGVDVGQALPVGLRLSPGKRTLLGTSGDDTLATGNGFTAVLAGAGDDRLFGSDDPGTIDKLFGGRGDDIIHWSPGFAVVHGGEPGLAYAEDGVDAIDYSGAGRVRLEAPRPGAEHVTPDFIATYASGRDHLFSIEEIVWDGRSDTLSIGPGVGLASPPLRIDFGDEETTGKGDVIDLSEADAGFHVVAGDDGALNLTARVAWSGAEAHGLTVHGAEWIVGSPHGDRMVLPPGLRGVEGGGGDDIFDLRNAGRLFVAPGAGDDTLIVGGGEVVARGGAGTHRYLISHASGSLVIEEGMPADRIVVTWTPAHVRAGYDSARPEDLVVRLFPLDDVEEHAEIRIRRHQAGDLGLDIAQDISLVEDADGLRITSRAPGPLADGQMADDVASAATPVSTGRPWSVLDFDGPEGFAACGLTGLSMSDPWGLLGGG